MWILATFPFLTSNMINDLKTELPSNLATVDGVLSDLPVTNWWKNHESELPAWSKACKMVLLVQPSSATAERVFSLLQKQFL